MAKKRPPYRDPPLTFRCDRCKAERKWYLWSGPPKPWGCVCGGAMKEQKPTDAQTQ